MSLFDWLLRRPGVADRDVAVAIESLVGAMDPRLRLVDAYARKLRPAVALALTHLESVVAGFPGPVDFSRSTWGSDPLVKAFFASPQSLALSFSSEAAVQDFFAALGAPDACYIALFVTQKEKSSLGFAMQGEMLQSGVVRQSISFSAHKLTRPAATEAGVRAGVRDMGLHYLASQALEQIGASRRQRLGLEEARDMLNMRLRSRSRFDHAEDEQGNALDEDTEILRQQLADMEARLASLGAPAHTLDEYLAQLIQVLVHAPDYLSMHCRELSLDSMNFIEDSPTARPMTLWELHALGRPSRAVVIARFPRRDLISKSELAASAVKTWGAAVL